MLETMPHCLYNSQLCTCLSGCLWVYQEKVRGVVYGGLVERMHPVLTDLCSTVWLLSCDVDVQLCREEADRNQTACQHFQNHLLVRNEQMDRAPAGSRFLITLCLQRAGLQGLSLNVSWNKAHRLNNNMAVQHRQQTVIDAVITLQAVPLSFYENIKT